jgi:hypothetical protein
MVGVLQSIALDSNPRDVDSPGTATNNRNTVPGVAEGGEPNQGHPSIAIVSTHFGRAPAWLPAFMLSCRENPDISWLIYTDIHVDGPVPPNVHVKPMQLAEFNRRCSDTLGVRVNVQSTFLKKLSDLKPAYGLVFADDLRSFDFWAYSELDVIWGDIRYFMTDGLLADHDLLSASHYKLCGHFTLWRNIDRMNRMFEIVPDALQIMADPRHFRLDERPFTRQLLLDAEKASASYPRIYWEPLLTMSAEYQRALPNGPGGNLWWCRGKTYDAECHELMYLHFHKLKKHMTAINFGYEDSPASFMINRNGVHCRRGAIRRRNATERAPARLRAV